MRKNHNKIVCIKLVHLPYLQNQEVGRLQYEVYNDTAMRMLLYNFTSWTEKYGQILEIRILRPEQNK